jgi:hypothetical protein
MLRQYFGPNLVTVIAPLIMIGLAIPMILEKVPRNYLYGFRTRYTLSSDEVWYRANKISGIAIAAAGVAWLIVGVIIPDVRLVVWIGSACLIVAIAVSSWLTYSK